MAPALCLSSCLMSLRLLLDQPAKVPCFCGADTSDPGPLSQALGRSQTSGFPYWTLWQQCQLTFLLMDLLQFLHTSSSTVLSGEDTLLPLLSYVFSRKACMSSCSFSMSCVGQKWAQKDAAVFGSGELFGDPCIPGLSCAHLLKISGVGLIWILSDCFLSCRPPGYAWSVRACGCVENNLHLQMCSDWKMSRG